LITGASGGFGKALATSFWAAGASVFLTGRNAAALEALRAELEKTGIDEQRIAIHACALESSRDAEDLAQLVEARFGAPSILVNNAATQGPIGALAAVPFREWERAIQIDFIVPAALCARFLPAMRAERRGKIINIAGGGATGPRPNFSAYAASKTALVRLTEVLAHENRDAGIDVNAISPGAMNTAMLQQVLDAGVDAAGGVEFDRATKQALDGGVAPERAAALAVFLASHRSDGLSGRLISAVWDDWQKLAGRAKELEPTDIFTLRRIVPSERGKDWG
jgi:NAD(P)-dependent dehydrogenase (short-subunit alcohol dehydrogenase family)